MRTWAILDARWAGIMAEGARVYPVTAYRDAFAVCALFVLVAGALSLFLVETRCENVHHRLRPAAGSGPRKARAES